MAVPPGYPRLACCNFLPDEARLKALATGQGLDGIEWTFTQDDFPRDPRDESLLARRVACLRPLEIRYHCAFSRTDLGDEDPLKAEASLRVFRRVCLLVSRLEGRFLTIHVGLGLSSTSHLSWMRTIERLANLVRFANGLNVRLCLENLAWGWTSRPELFEKILRKTGCEATLDIGHARISPSVRSQQFAFEDFVSPHPERFLGAHIYHEERDGGHWPPQRIEDLADRLRLLMRLPLCNWWVLELREEKAFLQTLEIVRSFLDRKSPGSTGK